jgi:hypothetical protein
MPDFIWPIHAPEGPGLRVIREIGFREGEDYVLERGGEDAIFRFVTTEQAMQFNRGLAAGHGPVE